MDTLHFHLLCVARRNSGGIAREKIRGHFALRASSEVIKVMVTVLRHIDPQQLLPTFPFLSGLRVEWGERLTSTIMHAQIYSFAMLLCHLVYEYTNCVCRTPQVAPLLHGVINIY